MQIGMNPGNWKILEAKLQQAKNLRAQDLDRPASAASAAALPSYAEQTYVAGARPIVVSKKHGSDQSDTGDATNSELEFVLDIVHLDVAQGEATLITLTCERELCERFVPKETGVLVSILIDGGLNNEGGGLIGRVLRSAGVEAVDAAIISHFDADHSDGVFRLVKDNHEAAWSEDGPMSESDVTQGLQQEQKEEEQKQQPQPQRQQDEHKESYSRDVPQSGQDSGNASLLKDKVYVQNVFVRPRFTNDTKWQSFEENEGFEYPDAQSSDEDDLSNGAQDGGGSSDEGQDEGGELAEQPTLMRRSEDAMETSEEASEETREVAVALMEESTAQASLHSSDAGGDGFDRGSPNERLPDGKLFGKPVYIVDQGDELTLECAAEVEFRLTCVRAGNGPISKGDKEDIENFNSLAWVLQFGAFTYFTAGDLPSEIEDDLGPELTNEFGPMTALKCGHHGANTSTSSKFLEAIRPQLAFVSAGRHEGYKHPAAEALIRLNAAKSVRGVYLTNCYFDRPFISPGYVNRQLVTLHGGLRNAMRHLDQVKIPLPNECDFAVSSDKNACENFRRFKKAFDQQVKSVKRVRRKLARAPTGLACVVGLLKKFEQWAGKAKTGTDARVIQEGLTDKKGKKYDFDFTRTSHLYKSIVEDLRVARDCAKRVLLMPPVEPTADENKFHKASSADELGNIVLQVKYSDARTSAGQLVCEVGYRPDTLHRHMLGKAPAGGHPDESERPFEAAAASNSAAASPGGPASDSAMSRHAISRTHEPAFLAPSGLLIDPGFFKNPNMKAIDVNLPGSPGNFRLYLEKRKGDQNNCMFGGKGKGEDSDFAIEDEMDEGSGNESGSESGSDSDSNSSGAAAAAAARPAAHTQRAKRKADPGNPPQRKNRTRDDEESKEDPGPREKR